MRLIIGLGNPGRRYADSRHNLGFKCVDHMARMWGISLRERRSKAVLGQGDLGEVPVVLAKPRTFMNLSGEGVSYLLTRFAAKPEDLVVIYDEMDLPPGTIRIRPTGSAAGHNGVQSIIDAIATQQFPRVRMGIGTPPEGIDGIKYVLAPFSAEETIVVHDAVGIAAEAVACMLQEGIDAAMNRFNRGSASLQGAEKVLLNLLGSGDCT